TRSDVDPQLLTGTDLRGSDLANLRRPRSWTANYSLAVRRSQRSTSWLLRGLVDPLSLNANFTQGRSRSELSSARSDAYSASANYNLQLKRAGLRLPLSGIVGALPKWLRESDAGKGLQSATLSLVPTNLRWSSGLSRAEGDYSSFAVPIIRGDDSLVRPTLSLTHLWRNSGGLTWQPLGMLTLNGDLVSTRDLRVYPDSSSLGRLAYAERRFLLGLPVGVERDRTFNTALSLTPKIASWLRPRFTTSSSFLLSRTLNTRSPVRAEEDSGAFILPQTLNNRRATEIGVSVDLSRAMGQIVSDSSTIGRLFARVRPVDLSSQLTRSSTFDLAAFDPGFGYQLGLGGRDRFLGQEGTGAISASEGRTATLSSGADLPFGLTATMSYSLTRTENFRRLGDGLAETVIRQREWPVANVRWSKTFRGGPFATVAAGVGVRRREGTSVQPIREGPGAESATSSASVIPDLQLTFRNGMNVNLGLSSRDQRTDNNGNETRLDQDDINGTFSYSFRLPQALSRSRRTARSSLSALWSTSLTCLSAQQGGECSPISDVRRQEIRAGLDTDLLRILSGGLQFGYTINDARHLSRRTSQIFLLASFQLSLFTADYR
ncbi:MAG: hypothetical protein H0T44_00970, partial [Gemmatimonadales bacterium]|nr:hypothetical protein [Gemmatimonadales bacterium]